MENPSAFPMGEPNDGFAQYFVGQSYLAPVLESPQIAIHNVTFEPGCRNNWHIPLSGLCATPCLKWAWRSFVLRYVDVLALIIMCIANGF